MERFTIKNSDVLTTASRYNELRGINMKKKIFYIPHGVEPEIKKTKINLDSLKTSTKNLNDYSVDKQTHRCQRISLPMVFNIDARWNHSQLHPTG